MLRFGEIPPVCGHLVLQTAPPCLCVFCSSLQLLLQVSGVEHQPWQADLAVLPAVSGADEMETQLFSPPFLPTPQPYTQHQGNNLPI